jgi:hypothetical protein
MRQFKRCPACLDAEKAAKEREAALTMANCQIERLALENGKIPIIEQRLKSLEKKIRHYNPVRDIVFGPCLND